MPPRIRTSRRKRPSWLKLKHPLSASKFLTLLNCSTSLLRPPTAQPPPHKLETERPLMFDLDPYLKMAVGLGCTEDQVKNLLKAGITLQYKQLAASGAARACDLPDGPVAVGFGGGRCGGKSFWMLAQMGLDDCQRVPEGLGNCLAKKTLPTTVGATPAS